MSHLRRDWARPSHIFTGTGLTPATSAPRPPCVSQVTVQRIVRGRLVRKSTTPLLHALRAQRREREAALAAEEKRKREEVRMQ